MLKVDKLHSDPRVKEAKRLILEAVQDAKAQFTGAEEPKAVLKMHYEMLLAQFAEARGTPLYYPYLGSGIGSGPLVELLDGSCKYDLISGIGVHYFGHSSLEVIESSLEASLSDTVMQGNLQQNKESLDLIKLYINLSGLDHCFLTTSGAMACENCLKIAFQKKHPASRVLAFERGFAGRTLALSQITDKPAFREGLPATITVDYIPFYDPNRPEASINALKSHIKRYPNQHAVMCMELVQGEGGFWTAPGEFFKQIIQVLKEHKIAVWADEIQTFCRTEEPFAFKKLGLDGLIDLCTIGKVSHACATLYKSDYKPRPGLLSQTFTASTSAIYASKCMVEHAIQQGLFGPHGKIAKMHKAFTEELKKFDALHGPYGTGSMVAFTPFDGEEQKVKEFVQKLFNNGVIGFVAGSNPCRVRFLLPVAVMTEDDIPPIMAIIEKTIDEMLT